MRGPVLVSVGVHAALIAAVAAGWHTLHDDDDDHDSARLERQWAIELVVPRDVDLVPLDVALVTVPEAGDGGGAAVIEAPAGRGRVRIAATTRGGAGTATNEPGTDRGDHRASMRMRGLRHDLKIPEAAFAKILTKPGTPYVPPTSERLAPSGGGTHEIRDTVATVKVAPDGTVDIEDKPDATFKLYIPLSRQGWDDLRRAVGAQIDAWLADPYRMKRPIPTDEIPRACMMHLDVCYSGGGDVGGIALGGGKLEISDALHRKLIGDPYTSRKLKALDTTREARVHIGAKHREALLDRTSELAQRNVAALWRAGGDATTRRAALFAMWDECEEGEGLKGRAGAQARAIVIGFIRAKLPPGSPDAFTDDEIARFNARRTSRQRFAPY